MYCRVKYCNCRPTFQRCVLPPSSGMSEPSTKDRGFYRAELHPLDILSRYTSLSLLLEPTTHCHWPVPSRSSLTATGHLGTGLLYKPRSFVFGSLIPDEGGSTHLWNVGRQLFYTAVYPRRQLWSSLSRSQALPMDYSKPAESSPNSHTMFL
jgi:hypothetical protein